MQQNKTSLVQSPFTTLSQEMRLAYSTTLLTEPTWGRMDGWLGLNGILSTQVAAISCLTDKPNDMYNRDYLCRSRHTWQDLNKHKQIVEARPRQTKKLHE